MIISALRITGGELNSTSFVNALTANAIEIERPLLEGYVDYNMPV